MVTTLISAKMDDQNKLVLELTKNTHEIGKLFHRLLEVPELKHAIISATRKCVREPILKEALDGYITEAQNQIKVA